MANEAESELYPKLCECGGEMVYVRDHGRVFSHCARCTPVVKVDVSKLNQPFEVGTVRGPYTCGNGTNPEGGVQFLVKSEGGWVPFIEARHEVAKARQAAESYAKEITGKKG